MYDQRQIRRLLCGREWQWRGNQFLALITVMGSSKALARLVTVPSIVSPALKRKYIKILSTGKYATFYLYRVTRPLFENVIQKFNINLLPYFFQKSTLHRAQIFEVPTILKFFFLRVEFTKLLQFFNKSALLYDAEKVNFFLPNKVLGITTFACSLFCVLYFGLFCVFSPYQKYLY